MNVNKFFSSSSDWRRFCILGVLATLRSDELSTGWKQLGDVIHHNWFQLIIALSDMIVAASTFVSMWCNEADQILLLCSVNAVDVLYAAFPAYLYLNPDLGSYVLRPLLHVQSSPIFPHPYAAPDLGKSSPLLHSLGLDYCIITSGIDV